MRDKKGLLLGLLAMAIYIMGGGATFGGIGMIAFLKGRDIAGVGDAATFGYLVLCVGLCLSVTGVLLMRVMRNRYLV